KPERDYEAVIKEERAAREELQKQLNEERDIRLTREYIAKAQSDFNFLPLSADKLGPVIKQIAELAPDAWKELEPVLKGASELISKSALLAEKGSRVASGGDAWGKIEAAAKTLVEKGDRPLSLDEAIDRVIDQHPQLYLAYERERQADAR